MSKNKKKQHSIKKKQIKKVVKEETFFQEKSILIDVPGVDPFTVFMRPVKVKEIQILNRIIHLQERDQEDEQAAMMMMLLMVETLNVTSEQVPAVATAGLIGHFIEYNFPTNKEETDKQKPTKKKSNNGIIECFDFLIAHGHKESEIMEYTIPRFNDYITTLAERLGIKKKPVSAEDAFRQLGIPIKPRGEKKSNE